MIRVCLVDDQTLVRQGVKSLLALAEGIEVIAEAGDGRQAVELIPQVRPDVVLMDMRMPVMSGLEALQALSAKGQLPPTTAAAPTRPPPATACAACVSACRHTAGNSISSPRPAGASPWT